MYLEIVATTFVAVFTAELVGDKTLYTLSSLTAGYRATLVLIGASIAFMAKALVAVAFGRFLAMLPGWFLAVTSALTFVVMAVVLFWKKPVAVEPSPRASRALFAGFLAIFCSEWADIGQLTTGLVAARLGHPFLVWCGAVSAMMAKAVLATTAGVGLRRLLDPRVWKGISVGSCLLLGVLSLVRFD